MDYLIKLGLGFIIVLVVTLLAVWALTKSYKQGREVGIGIGIEIGYERAMREMEQQINERQ